jgi:CRISPR-associated protein Cas2
MFDLPTDTSKDQKNYRYFRRFLLQDGFVMMQESIYTKICLNMHAVSFATNKVRANKPPQGLIQMMFVTEKQFASMELVVGEQNNTYVQSDERLIVL